MNDYTEYLRKKVAEYITFSYKVGLEKEVYERRYYVEILRVGDEGTVNVNIFSKDFKADGTKDAGTEKYYGETWVLVMAEDLGRHINNRIKSKDKEFFSKYGELEYTIKMND